MSWEDLEPIMEGVKLAIDESLDAMLEGIPQGDVLKDPREGEHEDVLLQAVDISPNKEGSAVPFSFIERWTGMKDEKGRPFDFNEYIQIPTGETRIEIKRMFLAHFHDLGALDKAFKNALTAETDEHRQKLRLVLRKVVGQKYPVKISESNGFIHLRVRRRRT